MSKYGIEIDYRTGNSFGSEDQLDMLELTWSNLDVAKENLQRIKEHYEMVRAIENRSWNSKQTPEEIINQNKDKDWFVNQPKLFKISSNRFIDESQKSKCDPSDLEYRPDRYYACHCIYLKADNGNNMQISTYWTGYFEYLHGAEIKAIEDESMRISF